MVYNIHVAIFDMRRGLLRTITWIIVRKQDLFKACNLISRETEIKW